ncbi:hypothetical protein CYMTET_48845 [Cymbomonas tetramitiformis]|uniref:non-specific serine/threonine protein kinase n=1 Tax=Cymbomonas tetramitiformis TaxID=36881 RepID=A0AAE0BT35_9CHLO|nr:hypothetical protein CYMTET_48845 [Cymbomonas tetramitiformis]
MGDAGNDPEGASDIATADDDHIEPSGSTDSLDQDEGQEKYTDVCKIARGGFGVVRLVKRKCDDCLFVIKKLLDGEHLEDFTEAEHEVKVMNQLDHMHIIGCLESFRDDEGFCIVQEYAERGTLAHQIREWREKGQAPDEREVLDIFLQILLALHHIHKHRIMHRDLKPENIFITKADVVKVGDFGLSKVLSADKKKSRTYCGTPNYLSPEVVEGRPYDMKNDMWALGCVLYEMMTLKRAFDDVSAVKLVMAITGGEYEPLDIGVGGGPRLRQLCGSLLSYESRDRPTTADVLNLPFIQSAQKLMQERLDSGMPLGSHRKGSGTFIDVAQSAAMLEEAKEAEKQAAAAAAAADHHMIPRERANSGKDIPHRDKAHLPTHLLKNRKNMSLDDLQSALPPSRFPK